MDPLDEVRAWLRRRAVTLGRSAIDLELDLDVDLIEHRIVDSLALAGFIIFLEELRGRAIDVRDPATLPALRTLRTIRDRLLAA